MKRVLVIVPHFRHFGSQRAIKFVKYLPVYGWIPSVLTVKHSPFSGFDRYDSSLLAGISEEVKLFEVSSFDPSILISLWKKGNKKYDHPDGLLDQIGKPINKVINHIFIPDIRILWAITATPKAKGIIKYEDIDLVYTISPPHSTHLIGYLLKKITGKPWVVDFKDGWAGDMWKPDPYYKPLRKIYTSIEKYMEDKVLTSADKIVCATEGIENWLKNLHPHTESTKFITITNGFDADDFRCVEEEKNDQKFTIVYTGSLSHYRSPDYFIMAVEQLIDEHKDLRHEIQVLFVGVFPQSSKQLIESLSLSEIIKPVGLLPHSEAIRYQLQSNTLLLLNFPADGGKAVFTGKVFEYIAAGKPILALIGDSHAADLIHSENLGVVVPPYDVQAIKDAIYDMYLKYKQGNLNVEIQSSLLKKFDRKELTRALANSFDEVIDAHKR